MVDSMTVQESRGYALIAALILLVIASLGVVVAVQRAQLEAQREREAELLFVGDQFRQALAAYASAPGVPKQYPQALEDLLEDKRTPQTRRYLRHIYPDPMTGKADWELERAQDRIVAVHSRSTVHPLRHSGFSQLDADFAMAETYQQWRFSTADAPGASVPPLAQGGSSQGSSPQTGPGTPSGNSSDTPAPPSPRPDPRTQCFAQYSVPYDRCAVEPPPLGNDTVSCMRAYRKLLVDCLAAAGAG
jgi:type II secretory pathway pseudopilin PulG